MVNGNSNNNPLRAGFQIAPKIRAMHRHFERQWPKPKKKGAQGGWVLVNRNYPVVTNIQLKEKTAHSVIISTSMEEGESGVS